MYALLLSPLNGFATPEPVQFIGRVQLAKAYHKHIQVRDYFVSEKLDGVRARWTGTELLTRNGNRIHAPAWFTQGWPDVPMDGELWTKRNDFENIVSIVLSDVPDQRWRTVRMMMFDLPEQEGPFHSRVKAMETLIHAYPQRYLAVVPQWKVNSHQALEETLDQIVSAGGEGVMLHHQDARYRAGRSNALLKVKRFEDDEAKVVGYVEGKGKFAGMLGALQVESKNGVRFKIGTGFSLAQRQHPPSIGSWVTFKFYGRTKNNKPKFASFLRVRPEVDLSNSN